ncbi:MAG: ATP-binding protein, partial [bacterium]
GKRREARYTNLDPGDYTFWVKACNNDGVWNERATLLAIAIVPPFWRTWWFFGIALFAGAGAFGGTVRFISTQKLKKQIELLEQEKAIQDERLRTRERIARDLHDDLASTVGSANFFIESVKNELSNASETAKEFLNKTSSLLVEAEESMSDIVWSVSPVHDTMESLLSRIRITTGDVCRANHTKYEVVINGPTERFALSDEARRGIYLIFKEALSNAARHSSASLINVSAVVSGETVEIRVNDNGSGLASLEQKVGSTKRGHGIRNMRKRAEEIGAELTIDSKPGTGTTIRLIKRMTQTGH